MKNVFLSLSLLAAMPAMGASLQYKFNQETECLASAIHGEARGEGSVGKWLVTNVILNRAEESNKTICSVVNQPHQFSYNHIAMHKAYREGLIPQSTIDMAKKAVIMWTSGVNFDLTEGATYYHTISTKTGWDKRMHSTIKYGKHIFYKE